MMYVYFAAGFGLVLGNDISNNFPFSHNISTNFSHYRIQYLIRKCDEMNYKFGIGLLNLSSGTGLES